MLRRIGGKVSNSAASIILDSDSEEEPNRKGAASRKRRLSSCLADDGERAEEVNSCRQTIYIYILYTLYIMYMYINVSPTCRFFFFYK